MDNEIIKEADCRNRSVMETLINKMVGKYKTTYGNMYV